MKTQLSRAALLLALVAFWIPTGQAQNRTVFGGSRNAVDYAFGVYNSQSALSLDGGPYGTGTQTFIVAKGSTVTGDGIVYAPLSTVSPIRIGGPTNQETVTPTVVNCSTPDVYDSCTFTASVSNIHGRGETITTASVGLQEALNLANGSGGGSVIISPGWSTYGGTTAMITAAVPYPVVPIIDNRGLGVSYTSYWSDQPSTLTSLAVPATLTSTTVTFTAAPVGTWGTSAYYFCVTYVDQLGGESPCSLTYTQTPGTTAYSLNITSPPASTGAVGWRAYGGVTSVALAYLLPVTSSACTLTTQEVVMPACAIGSNGVWPAIYLTTTALSPAAIIQTTNVDNPVFQGHTTFAYQPTASLPVPFQTNFGPFGTALTATASDVTVLGSMNLPAGYLNQIGRVLRITGKIVGGETTTGYLKIYAALGWAGGDTAGLPVTACLISDTAATFTTATVAVPFDCTLTTNAVGATAVGTVMAEGWAIGGAAGVLGVAWTDNSTSAVGSLGLFSQDTLYIYVIPITENLTSAQLISLHIETVL